MTSALYSTLRALMQTPGTFAPLFALRRLEQPPISLLTSPVHSSELARQRPNVNPPRMDSHHSLSLSLSSSPLLSSSFPGRFIRTLERATGHHGRTAESGVVIARRQPAVNVLLQLQRKCTVSVHAGGGGKGSGTGRKVG